MFTKWNKAFDKLRHQHDTWYIFKDFLDMTIDNFTLPGMPPLFTHKDKYTKEEYAIFGELFAAYVQTMDEVLQSKPYYDFLGAWWESDVNMTNKFRAQFFTPQDVASLMADLVLDDELWGDEPRVMYDCCAGSARFGLAYHHKRPMDMFFFQDLDDYAVKMSVLNMLMHGMSGVVAHMNSLTREVFWCCRVNPYPGLYGPLPYVVPYGVDLIGALQFLPKVSVDMTGVHNHMTSDVDVLDVKDEAEKIDLKTTRGGLDAWMK
jgi:hypothetical protein